MSLVMFWVAEKHIAYQKSEVSNQDAAFSGAASLFFIL